MLSILWIVWCIHAMFTHCGEQFISSIKLPAPVATIVIHWGWDKMDNILQTIFSNAFPQCKLLYFNSLRPSDACICVGNLTIIGPDNGLSPGQRQAIIWTNAGILLIEPCGTNFSEILIGIQTSSFKKMHLKMSSAKWRLFCLGLNVLIQIPSKLVPKG